LTQTVIGAATRVGEPRPSVAPDFTLPSSIGNSRRGIIRVEDDAMMELLGVGLQGPDGQWLLRRGCARVERGMLTALVAPSTAERDALLDAVAGKRLPDEGRVWVARLPLMPETTRRVRALVPEQHLAGRFLTHRSVLWNTLVPRGTALAGLVRFPRRAERRAVVRALEALGLGRRVHDPLAALSSAERAGVGVAERVAVIVGQGTLDVAREHADRVLGLADGRLSVDTLALELRDRPVSRPLANVVFDRREGWLGVQASTSSGDHRP
jgi:ABC-type phosphate/phosphonate transport system ATPase subunit